MTRFFISRLLQTLLALFVIVTATFFMSRFAPGGPFTAEKSTTPEIEANIKAYYNLDKPLWWQYRKYMWDVMPKTFRPTLLFSEQGGIDLKAGLGVDFGPSYKYSNRTVNEIIAEELPVSIQLGLPALAIALGIGITLGVLAALKRNTWVDYAASTFGMVGLAVPTFVVGPIFVLIFALQLHWFNASGWYTVQDRVLPCFVLGLAYAAPIVRLTRGGMLEVLNQDFIRTARAKGASEARVVFRHALRGGLLPVVSYLGPAVANILTGSFVIETIFQIPGLGREFVNSAFNRDYFMILGTVILYATLIMTLNLLVDIAQAWMNPKVRLEN
ncbi:oligopeptide transport system permease protein [Ereboglobus sp. PH5-10]|uniref:ABC transporter permease n=1 Tax=Ereboglobus sp. PH5-10 TaxID=2940629 RepID=UPI002406A260|nr:ABC transporter permease subunit [Ereboglobus sp. PH5-10]MDF9825957.1 oligopeptide transport system permease protein [Ereboglobus sp. PH5-10]